ncbi:MAG: phosphonate ABC transporter, permease protein PhnE [Ferrovibrio sp.]|uniref:phosphonate ABC transporter, permease protein PhnE n=1 Tax=Ferrovibrio sp. TaxID=1917215 RepID=UPI00391AB767
MTISLVRTSLLDFNHAWNAERARSLRLGSIATLIFLGACAFAAHIGQFDIFRLIDGLPKVGDFISGMVPPIRAGSVLSDIGEWYWGLGKWLGLLWTTALMAILATAVGAMIGGALSFVASANLVQSKSLIFIVRRVLEVSRTVPDLVWALIFLFAFGLGPLAGFLAIMVHTVGAQGKLFAEVNENIDRKPIEGVRAAGGTWFDEIVIGVLPQVLPNYVSYTLWRFELNVRSATIIGFVGAGGIGMELYEVIRLSYFDDAGAILLIILIAVILIDMLSEWARLKLAGIDGNGHQV